MTRTTKTAKTSKKTSKVEVKEPSRKPETSREEMSALFREYVEERTQRAERCYGVARVSFLDRFNDPTWGAADALAWRGGDTVMSEYKAKEWARWASELVAADNPAAILEVIERWRESLMYKLYEVSRGNRSTSTFHNAVDGFIAEAAADLMRYGHDMLRSYAANFAEKWDTAPATEQDAWDALTTTEKVEYLTWKTDTGQAYTEIEKAWTPRQEA